LDESDDYDRFAEEDGRGWMSRLMQLRDELLRGDMRPLYLGWLAGVSAGEVNEQAIEPLPPPGLSRLTAAQHALAEFMDVDEDLLTAAGLSDRQSSKLDNESNAELDVWVAALPTAEKTAMLKLLLTGRAQQAERKLKLRFLAWQRLRQPIEKPETRRCTVAELQKLAVSAAEARNLPAHAGCRFRPVLASCREASRTWHRLCLRRSKTRSRRSIRCLCALRFPS
jgi:hypothetical protein